MKKIPKYPKKDFLESLLDNPNIFIVKSRSGKIDDIHTDDAIYVMDFSDGRWKVVNVYTEEAQYCRLFANCDSSHLEDDELVTVVVVEKMYDS